MRIIVAGHTEKERYAKEELPVGTVGKAEYVPPKYTLVELACGPG